MTDKSNCCTTSCQYYQYCAKLVYATPCEWDENGEPIKAVSCADGKTYTVYKVENGQITIKDKQYPIKLVDGFYIIRKLTVRECMRLQTVPEWYEFPVSDTQAYKMLGNGWTCEVIAHLIRACIKNEKTEFEEQKKEEEAENSGGESRKGRAGKMTDAVKIVGGNGKRRPNDFYPTPPEVTKALIEFLEHRELLKQGARIWECACGSGEMANVFRNSGYEVTATDIQSGTDFFTARDPNCDWIITNPPFNRSAQFIEKAASFGKPFAFLLKTQYWHSAKRLELYEEYTPAFILPLTWRPDFTGQGSSLMDMIWVVWLPGIDNAIYRPLKKPKGGMK